MNKEKIAEYLRKMKPIHKYMIVTVLLIVITGVSLLFMKDDGYSAIYKELSESDRTAILNEMQKMGVEYTETEEGVISVKDSELTYVRNRLTDLGLPSETNYSFDNFFESSLGTTQSEKDLRELASRKGQIESDILGNFSNIESVSVQLVLPEDGSIFEVSTEGGSASVLIKQKGKTKLTSQQISGLQHMIATAVPGVKAEEVKIIDNELGVISLTDEEQKEFKNAYEKQLEIVKNAEEEKTLKIRNSLTNFFGQENLEISVDMAINFDEIEKQIEVYGDKGVLRSTQRESEVIVKNDGSIEPEAGVETGGDVTTYENQVNENGDNYSSDTKKDIENYEINKTVENITKYPELTNTNIVVWVDRTKMREKGIDETKFANAIAIAAGLDVQEDGTYLNGQVSVMQIDKEAPVASVEEEVASKNGGLGEFIKNNIIATIVIALLALGMVVFAVLYFLKRKKQKEQEVNQIQEMLGMDEKKSNSKEMSADMARSELKKFGNELTENLDELSDEEIFNLMEEKRGEIRNEERSRKLQDMLEKEKNEIKEKKMLEVKDEIERLGSEYPNETAEYLRTLLK